MSQHARVTGIVDRSRSEWQTGARCLVHLTPELMDELVASPGQVVEIATDYGRRTLGRIGDPQQIEGQRSSVFLDRFTRESLKARMNDRVDLELHDDLPDVTEVTLAAPVDPSRAHGLIEHLRLLLTDARTPLMTGARVYLPLPHSSAGMVYEVTELIGGPGFFAADTKLRVEPPGMRHDETKFDVTFEDIGGLQPQIVLLRELVQLPLQMPYVYRQLGILPPRGIILHGPPGAGKTHLARALSNEVNARFYTINGPDIVGTMQGETESNLRRIFDEASHHAPSVILIDELDAVAPHRGESGSQSDVRAVTTLLSLMDGLRKVDGVMLIATTNRIDSVDVALRRPGRFDREVLVGPPDADGRLEILEVHTREMPLTDEALTYLPHLAKITHGYVGADLLELSREAGLNALRRSKEALSDHLGAFRIGEEGVSLEVEPRDFDEAFRRVHPSALRESAVAVPEVSWDDIGGLENVKHQLRNLVERPLLDPTAYSTAGLRPPSGVLLYGPSGTGKSMLVHALAHSAKVNFLPIDGPAMFGRWLGESEQAVRQVFTVARQLAPAIVFFDQLDAIVPLRRGESETKTTERVVDQLLIELDSLRDTTGIVVLAATNRRDLIDPAVLRPGRFDFEIFVPLPDRADRVAIARNLLADVALADVSIDDAAELLGDVEGLSGAELAQVIYEARLHALEDAGFEPPFLVERTHLAGALGSRVGVEPQP